MINCCAIKKIHIYISPSHKDKTITNDKTISSPTCDKDSVSCVDFPSIIVAYEPLASIYVTLVIVGDIFTNLPGLCKSPSVTFVSNRLEKS